MPQVAGPLYCALETAQGVLVRIAAVGQTDASDGWVCVADRTPTAYCAERSASLPV